MNYLRFFAFVPERNVYIIERLGRFSRVLQPGFNWLTPFFDKVAYKHSIKEEALHIEKQTAITQDNVFVNIDGVLFIKILDPLKASYEVENPREAVKLLALTLMRSEIGKLRLDKMFQEREQLNKAINHGVNSAAEAWGMTCLRYEILNIDPPEDIKRSMQSEAEAERLKRKDILMSEAKKASEINIATGKNKSTILNAEGHAESIDLITDKESQAIHSISESISKGNGHGVINYILLQNYLKDYNDTLKKGNVTVAPTSTGQGGGGDLTTLAAMMLAGQGRPFQQRISENTTTTQRLFNKSEVQNTFGEPSQDDYVQVAEKSKTFDNPILYSSDDEGMQKKSVAGSHQEPASQVQQNRV